MKKFKTYSLVAFIVILLVIYFHSASTYFELKLAPYTDSFYAIRTDDGGYVYGKVTGSDFDWVRLEDVYYFQSVEVSNNTTNNLVAQSSNPLTAPENLILINKSHILSIEKIGEEAKFLEIIKR